MTQLEAAEFFDREIKARFPKWQPGEAAVDDWIGWLKMLTFEAARQAVRDHAFSTRLTYPVLKDIYRDAKKIQAAAARPDDGCEENREAVLLYSLESLENPSRRFHYFLPPGRAVPGERAVLAEAGRRRQMCEDLYGEQFRIVQQFTEVPEAAGSTMFDDQEVPI